VIVLIWALAALITLACAWAVTTAPADHLTHWDDPHDWSSQ
jgi:hypothetical protein